MCLSSSPIKRKRKPITHTEETKKKLSEIRKKWLNDNPDKHPWKRKDKFLSKPCEFFKDKLRENSLFFYEEQNLLKGRAYAVDIVFYDKMIGFEINGNQHYNSDKTLRDYYKKRKQEIENLGWNLYDIHYTKVYDAKFINELVEFIKNESEIINLEFNFTVKKPVKYCSCNKKITNNAEKCKKCVALLQKRKVMDRPSKEILLKEVNEIGYSATGRKYGVSDNCIRKWLK